MRDRPMKNGNNLHVQSASFNDKTAKEVQAPLPGNKYARVKLSSVSDCSKELAKLYREARSGRIDVADASKLSNILSILSRMLTNSELEARVEELEKRGWH